MKTREPITLTGAEAAMVRHLVKTYTWARYILRTYRCVFLLEGNWEGHSVEFPVEPFHFVKEGLPYEICVDEAGTVRLYEEHGEV